MNSATRSGTAGADALVSRLSDSVADLAGNRIVTDAAHLDFALQLASEVDPRPDVSIATDPAAAFAANPDIGFAVLDGAAATRITGGGVGTGAEGSVAGARKVLTTTSASRVIGDLLVVRADFMDAAPNKVDAAVRSLLKAEELVREDVKKQVVDFELAAEMLFGDPALADRVRDMWASVETVGLKGQTDWSDPADPRSYRALVNAGQSLMVETGLIDAAIPLADPSIDYAALGDGIWDKRRVNAAGFDQDAASAAIRAMSSAERDGSTIASVTILFEPNQAVFPVETYREEFEAALEKSRVYAGAVLSIEAHSSNLAYVRGVIEQDWAAKRQKRELASLNAISARRALAVRDALIEAAEGMGFSIDESQITYTGRGISDPPRGYCKGLPCPPRSEQEWREQRRVVFRVIAVESEAEVFTPLVEW